ncbi:protein of unknown function [Listeria monocytogenes R479a]|nr:protein of unknown function [Listeria monocytogenes R479a]CUK45787.1 hypothetical protein LM500401_210168 [Listeria monocytogenes]CUL07474.1 hypothetical protein LM701345_140172 [Listeria monocytogenes]CUL70534.1 hypothetical protein LM801457_160168 [Listeria monocytogenes]CUL87016.1 hypothetical protein LM900335_150167 [Listeria monocytogenes]
MYAWKILKNRVSIYFNLTIFTSIEFLIVADVNNGFISNYIMKNKSEFLLKSRKNSLFFRL